MAKPAAIKRARRRVLLTGGTGFIGSHLAPWLARAGYEVHLTTRRPAPMTPYSNFVCELTDEIKLIEVFQAVRPDFLIHLAGRATPGRDFRDFEPHYEDNVVPVMTLAQTAPSSLKLALFFGSCEEYGNGPTPFREEQAPVCFSPYGWAKISAMHAAQMVSRQRGLAMTWARPFLTFGPGQKASRLVPSLIRGCLEGETIPLTGGEQTRDFIYVNDLCRMVQAMLEAPEKARGETLNLSSGQPRTVRSVAERIRDLVGSGQLDFGAVPYRADEAMSFYASNEKFERLFGKRELTLFDEALRRTIDAYRADPLSSPGLRAAS